MAFFEVAASGEGLPWELRARWIDQRRIVVVLTERCDPRRIEGHVSYVATTGAYATVAGKHVPLEDILAVRSPHHSQQPEDLGVSDEPDAAAAEALAGFAAAAAQT